MSQTNKIILTIILSSLITGTIIFLWQNIRIKNLQNDNFTPDLEFVDLLKYNCELSNGSFVDGSCICPIESFQTQEEMYDKQTGYCQTTVGGPGGDAFAAQIGLPYGTYSFWNKVLAYNCTETGGNWLNASCTCDNGLNYDKSTGQCK